MELLGRGRQEGQSALLDLLVQIDFPKYDLLPDMKGMLVYFKEVIIVRMFPSCKTLQGLKFSSFDYQS